MDDLSPPAYEAIYMNNTYWSPPSYEAIYMYNTYWFGCLAAEYVICCCPSPELTINDITI